jgi:hypothetical protein
MASLPDGIVTVHLGDKRYRGAYYFRGEKLVVTAYGLKEGYADLAVLAGERGKAALNLAKLVLIDMVRGTVEDLGIPPGLSLQGTTTQLCPGATTNAFFF